MERNSSDKRREELRDLRVALLQLSAGDLALETFADQLLKIMCEWSGCEAAAVWLWDVGVSPRFVSRGFPEKFFAQKNPACIMTDATESPGEARSDAIYSGLCSAIFGGQNRPDSTCFSAHGSFWVNRKIALMSASCKGLLSGPACVLGLQSFESVALVPLRIDDEDVIGLLQVNDRKQGRLTGETVSLLENLASMITPALLQRRTEQALQESEKRFHSLFDNSSNAVFLSDKKGRFLAANPAACAMFQRDAQELTRLSRADIFDTEEPRYPRRLEIQERTGRFQGELVGIRKDGSRFPAEISASEYCDRYGRLRVSAIVRDVSARKKAEVALRASEERYRRLFENNPLPMWVYDLETLRFQSVNQAAISQYGYSREEFLGMTLKDIRPEEDIPQLLQRVADLKGRFENVGVWRHRKKDGSYIDVEVTVHDLAFQGLQTKLSVLEDVTEKLHRRKEVEQAGRLAALGELAAGVAHEINNPINGIINYGQLLLNEAIRDGRSRDLPDRVIREGERIAGIVGNLLSFAREKREEKEPTEIAAPLAASLELVASHLHRDGIRLEVNLDENLPPVSAVGQQLQQVFFNIISNARYALNEKFPGNHPEKILAVSVTAVGRHGMKSVRITVTDFGSGIPDKVLDRVLVPFFTTKPVDKGTGLGLSISHGIVRDHGGTLQVESTEGKYTRVTFTLPAA